MRDLIAQKLGLLRGMMAELQRMETELASALRQCRKALRTSPKHPETCPVLAEIAKQGKK